jgi:hypothetical protein
MSKSREIPGKPQPTESAKKQGSEPSISAKCRSGGTLGNAPPSASHITEQAWEEATRTGLEPATTGSTVRDSNQLSYRAVLGAEAGFSLAALGMRNYSKRPVERQAVPDGRRRRRGQLRTWNHRHIRHVPTGSVPKLASPMA